MPSDPVALAKNLAMLSELRLKRASLKVGGGGEVVFVIFRGSSLAEKVGGIIRVQGLRGL